MKLIIALNSVWNVCIWYIIFESTLGCRRRQYVTAFSTFSYKLREQGRCCYYGQFDIGYTVGHRRYVPQIGGILSNRINKGFSDGNNYKVKCVNENNNWVEEDLMKDNGSLTNSIGDIERGIEPGESVSEDVDNETKDKNGLENMLVNKELSEIPTEKRIKIPYIVEYPTDRVAEEQDMTKEDVARSIMTELGFFYPSSSYSSFRYYGDTTSTFNTPDRGVTGSSSRVDNRDSDLTTGEAGGSTGCRSDMALVGTSRSNVTSSCTNEVGANSNSGMASGMDVEGLTFSQLSGTDGTVDEEQEDPKSYLLKTTLSTKLDKKEEDAPASILDEQESPVVGQQRVRWFPNYVSRSLRKLHDYLKASDLILDVRDGRMPYIPFNDYFFNIFESEFPMKPRITVFTHSDLLPRVGITDWLNYYRRINRLIANSYNANITDPTQRRVENRTMFVDARNGLKEIIYLRKHIYRMTRRVRERCIKRGMRPRGIRVIVVGMPNVGKSSLVNRLLGRRAARATAAPGTTRDISLYHEKVARNEGSSTNQTAGPTKSDTGAENDENETGSGHSARGFKRLVLIDTPGIIAPLTDLAKPLLKLLTKASNRSPPLKAFSTISSSGDGSFGIARSGTNVTYGNKGSVNYRNDRYSVANSSTINFGGPNVPDRQTMMLIYSGLNIVGESACEDDEVLTVILKEILRMLTIRPKYIETAKIRQKYPLLVTMINRFIAGGRGPNRDWLDLESEISYNLERISRWLFGGNLNSCCSKMLNDFRRGKLGHVMLQAPPYLPLFSTRASSSDMESGSGSIGTRASSSGLQVSPSDISGTESMKNEQASTSNTNHGSGKADGDTITLEYSMGAYEGW